MVNALHISEKQLSHLMDMARFGWWQADFTNKIYRCSDFIIRLFNLSSEILTFKEFSLLIREDYRARISHEFLSILEQEIYEQSFPVYTQYGVMWIHCCLGMREKDESGNLSALGYLQCIENRDDYDEKKIRQQQINNLLYQQKAISQSLLSFSKTEDISELINKILNDILLLFDGGRTYIFEFDYDKQVQSCIYESVNEQDLTRKNTLREINLSATPWWSNQLTSNHPVILFSLDELPEEAAPEKELFTAQGIKSLMAIPLMANDKAWGYMGVNIINSHRKWSNEDYQWLSSLSNIISICINLHKSRQQAQIDKQYLENLYQYMPIGCVRMKLIYDKKGQIADYQFIDANQASENIFGYQSSTFLGYTAKQKNILEPESLHLLNSVDLEKENQNYDIQLANGKNIHCTVYSPQPGEIVSLLTDTTDSVVSHEALDRSEKILRNIYDNIPVGIELYDKDGYLVDINNKDLEIFGVDRKDDVLGVSFFENPNIPPTVIESFKKREPIDFRLKYSFHLSKNYYSSQKQGHIDLFTKGTILYDSKENLRNYLFINIDNTETTNAFIKIKEFEDLFSVVANFAQVGFIRWNPLTDEGFAIDQWFENYNIENDKNRKITDVVGKYDTLQPEDRQEMLAAYQQILNGEITNIACELRIINPDGSHKWIRNSVIVKRYEPEQNIIELVGINVDITELKNTEKKLIEAKEKAEESDRLKSAFLANMSHEIRTPLNAIIGFSNLLIETNDEKEKEQFISIVEENNKLLLQLISDILDLSRIEAGEINLNISRVNINLLCEEIVRSLRIKAKEGVELLFEDHLPEFYLTTDKTRIHQVITNFVNNALKFTQKGSIRVGYRLQNHEVRFYVSDTGIGIAHDAQEKVFDRFVKLNNFIPGTGLGLSICKNIVKQFGGQIGVESEPGNGALFWFTLPLEQAD